MQIQLRYAGLDRESERRIRLAAAALAAHKISAVAAPWDGSRCDIVIANAENEYGQRALQISRQRGTPVLSLDESSGDGETAAQNVNGVAALTRRMFEIVDSQFRLSRSGDPAVDQIDPHTAFPALLRLAVDKDMASRDWCAQYGTTTVYLLRSSGRILSETHADRLRLRPKLGDGGWKFFPLDASMRAKFQSMVSASLESFLLAGAWESRHVLPAFPRGQYALRHWPDLGGASEIVEALDVVRLLLSRSQNAEEISSRVQLDARSVCACMWAFKAAGILSGSSAVTEMPRMMVKKPVSHGLLARLVRHFGLLRA